MENTVTLLILIVPLNNSCLVDAHGDQEHLEKTMKSTSYVSNDNFIILYTYSLGVCRAIDDG